MASVPRRINPVHIGTRPSTIWQWQASRILSASCSAPTTPTRKSGTSSNSDRTIRSWYEVSRRCRASPRYTCWFRRRSTRTSMVTRISILPLLIITYPNTYRRSLRRLNAMWQMFMERWGVWIIRGMTTSATAKTATRYTQITLATTGLRRLCTHRYLGREWIISQPSRIGETNSVHTWIFLLQISGKKAGFPPRFFLAERTL